MTARVLVVDEASRSGANPSPAIVVTGFPSEEQPGAALAAGATAIFAKPFEADSYWTRRSAPAGHQEDQ